MKKFIFPIICLLPLVLSAQTGYTIKGKVGKLNAPAKVYLIYTKEDKLPLITDSVEIKNGIFFFKGKVETLARAQLKVKHGATSLQKDAAEDILDFYLENTDMSIAAPDSIKNAKISGSAVNGEVGEMALLTKALKEKSDVFRAGNNSKTPEERKDREYSRRVDSFDKAIAKEWNSVMQSFIESHRNSDFALWMFKNFIIGYDIDLKTAEPEFNKFSERAKASYLGKSVLARIESAKKTAVGAMAMDFTQNDVNGVPVKLSDFRGKYVLLDFWASWCAPCRRENPNVVDAYNKYKDKNFTVLSVSCDFPGKREAWLDAIKADGLVWTQVSDLKGFPDNGAAKLYDIQGIPSNFLLDPTGKIIANNIMGDELQTKLAELLN